MLTTHVYPNGHILPSRHTPGVSPTRYSFVGGVTDSEGCFVESSLLHERPCDVGGAYEAACQQTEERVVFVGYLLQEWGNALTDGMKKLWFLQTDEGRRLIAEGYKVAFVTLHNTPLPAYYLALWQLAIPDLASECLLHVTSPQQFAEVVVPESSMHTFPDERRVFHPAFLSTLESMKARAMEGLQAAQGLSAPQHSTAPRHTYQGKRIYLTRRRFATGKDWGEAEVERFFCLLGFEVVAPELLSIPQQIALWQDAAVVATTEGSISHTALMMRKGGELILLRKADYLNGYQQSINELMNLHVTHLKAHHSIRANKRMPWAGPFYLCVTPEMRRWALAFCPEATVPRQHVPLFLRPSYWAYLLQLRATLHLAKDCIYILAVRLGLKRR